MMPSSSGQLVEIADVFSQPTILDETRDDLWIFGYGSLMWLPDFDYRVAVPARLQGWHRQFTCLSIKAWGTEEKPGLSAALHPGGRVLGVAFAVSPNDKQPTLDLLARREAAYRQASVSCILSSGQTLRGLTFVMNPQNGRFLCEPDETEQIRHIRQGDGPRGTSRFYLESTVHCLNELGSGKTGAHALLDRVRG